VKSHNYSKEVLYHFNCGNCDKWWTIADHHLLVKENKITCPHCEYKDFTKEIKPNEKG